MTTGSKIRLVLLCWLATWFLIGPGVRAANADVIYTYTGNAFNSFPTGLSCPPVCNVTGSFTVAQPLAADLNQAAITPISFSLTSSGQTLTDGIPADSSLAITTDAAGAITNWLWGEVGPASSPTARIVTENITAGDAIFDDVRLGTAAPPFVGPIVGQISNDPGTWSVATTPTTVPEPSGFLFFGTGLLGILGAMQRKRRI